MILKTTQFVSCKISQSFLIPLKKKNALLWCSRINKNEMHQSTRNRVTQYVRKDASLLYLGEGITPVNSLVDQRTK